MSHTRRNADESIRDLERQAATGDQAALERLVAARLRSGISVRARIEELLDAQLGPDPQRREYDLQLVMRAVAWLLSAPVTGDRLDNGRPWAWEELSSGSVLAVRRRDGTVTVGIHAPDSTSEWTIRFDQAMERLAERTEEPEEIRRHARRLPAPGHPGTSWPDLAHPAGVTPGGACFWDRHRHRAYAWGEITPAIARWAGQEVPDRIRLTEPEARWFVREIANGIDISDHDEVMRTLEDLAVRNRLLNRLRISEIDLLRGVMPPPEQGLQPESATGAGWADWAARRLVQILSARRADRKDLTVIPGRALDMESDPERVRRNVLETTERVARAHVLVYFKGSVSPTTARSRRSAWERVMDKSIAVEIMFPLDMKPTSWGSDTVGPNGLFYVSTGHGRFVTSYGAKDRDHAPFGLGGIAKLVEDVIGDFFPGAGLRTIWIW